MCNKKYQDLYYELNKETEKVRLAKANKLTIERNRKFILNYLLTNPCTDCGETDPVVLDFDHVKGIKTANVSTLMNNGNSIENLIKEIEKCEIRCANFHRRKTYKTLGHVSKTLVSYT